MPVNNVNSSEAARAEQLQAQRSAENAQSAHEKQRQEDDASTREVRRVAEEGRGENMDVTV